MIETNNNASSNDNQNEYNEIENNNDDKYKGFDYDPFSESNCISQAFLYWAYSILNLATKVKLTPKHLGKLSPMNDASNFAKHIEYFWETKQYNKLQSNALMKAILRLNLSRLFIILGITSIEAASQYLQVILLKSMLDYFEHKTNPSVTPLIALPFYQVGIMFLLCQFLNILITARLGVLLGTLGSRAGNELACFIYNKVLTASPSSYCQRSTHGEIVNHIQVDSEKINYVIETTPGIFLYPIVIIAYCYLLFDFFGIAFLFGLIPMVLCLIVNGIVFKKYIKIEEDMLKAKDNRMKVTTETFDNLKLLKMYNWERTFQQKIDIEREKEIAIAKRGINMTVLNISIFWFYPVAVAIVTIGMYQYLHDTFSIATMLIGLAIFARLQDPIRELPTAITFLIDAKISLSRIEKFIRQPNRNEMQVMKGEYDENGEYAIKMEDVSFTWGMKQKNKKDDDEDEDDDDDEEVSKDKSDSKSNKLVNAVEEISLIPNENKDNDNDNNNNKPNYENVLKNISLIIKPKELVGIIGEIGSGKSSLLEACLNSLIITNQNESNTKCIYINGKIGYVPQIPWIQNTTIKNNILLFKDYDKQKYETVLKLSQLEYDLNNFEGGDNTEIGEKGLNLSGGQKMRVAIARALYSEPNIYLFDDPISALDTNIGQKIMEDCIVNYLHNTTRIVVTHALHFLDKMDRIIYINAGQIKWEGTYDELVKQDFFTALQRLSKKGSENGSENIINSDKDGKNSKSNENESNYSEKALVKINADEDEEIGEVNIKVYKEYFRLMGGNIFGISIVLIMLLWQVNKGGSDLWLAYWSSKSENNNTNDNDNNKWLFFIIYSLLGTASVVFIFFRIFLLGHGTLRMGRTLHLNMINSLIEAPINLYHEITPRGQLHNRLTKDLESVQFLFFSVGNTLVNGFSVLGAIVLCSIYDLPSLLCLPIFGVIGYFLTKFYLIGSRQLCRIEAISRSPMLNTVNESLPGNTSIYTFQVGEYYLNKFYTFTNDNFKAKMFMRGIFHWFIEQYSFISFIYIVYLVIRTALTEDSVTPQSVSITFTYSVILQECLGFCFDGCAELETEMVSMERCLRYTNLIKEKDFHKDTDETLKQHQWPQQGKVKFENYSVKYRPNIETVLHNINFEVRPTERIGVTGRTGSGKSTLCLCLFRMLEPLTGTIYIDDVDITTIGLDLLRQNITIIPQDPCLMAGTLKYNVDPLNKEKEEDVYAVLKEVGFEETDKEKEEHSLLNRHIEQHGNNLSVGEKQLVCIARAILRKTKIVVMDEATAHIDLKTEEKIQKVFNEKLKGVTVITIAHRIKTIINYDRILVLENGKVVEFDTPDNLLKDDNSVFYKLYNKSII